MLERAGWIKAELSRRMQAMAGFRLIAVHDYRKLSLRIVKNILEDHLNDFRTFAATILGRWAASY
ncbi:hypothetical protein BH23ACT11_BH23ACT11_28110 [soil metagenome]